METILTLLSGIGLAFIYNWFGTKRHIQKNKDNLKDTKDYVVFLMKEQKSQMKDLNIDPKEKVHKLGQAYAFSQVIEFIELIENDSPIVRTKKN